MNPPFRLEPLADTHDRSPFACGQEVLDRYLRTQATQDIRRRVATCFVAIEAASGQVAGYYTIASASIPTPDLPPEITKRLPRYPSIPAVRIGRLAVDLKFSWPRARRRSAVRRVTPCSDSTARRLCTGCRCQRRSVCGLLSSSWISAIG